MEHACSTVWNATACSSSLHVALRSLSQHMSYVKLCRWSSAIGSIDCGITSCKVASGSVTFTCRTGAVGGSTGSGLTKVGEVPKL